MIFKVLSIFSSKLYESYLSLKTRKDETFLLGRCREEEILCTTKKCPIGPQTQN